MSTFASWEKRKRGGGVIFDASAARIQGDSTHACDKGGGYSEYSRTSSKSSSFFYQTLNITTRLAKQSVSSSSRFKEWP